MDTRNHWEKETPSSIKGRIQQALEVVDPVLIGFDANGIQELVTASSRPVAMCGASALIAAFDAWSFAGGGSAKNKVIFAGGGRGMWVVSSQDADAAMSELAAAFRDRTHGGVLAIARATLQDEAASLALLRLRLGNAKDEAPPPRVPLPTSRHDQCADCKVRRGTATSTRPGAEHERVCERCKSCVTLGGKQARVKGERGVTLEDLATEGKVAVVSADGNNMGSLFAGLSSLTEMAACSILVDKIFQGAHHQALTQALSDDERRVSPVAGGDDIRVFLPPERLLDYVTLLAQEVQQRASQPDPLHELLTSSTKQKLQCVGIGIGAVVAPHHYPASRLIAYAHEFEGSAKAICRDGKARSAFDFALLTSGNEMIEGRQRLAGAGRSQGTGESESAIEVPGKAWKFLCDKARLLTKLVPTSQLAQLFRLHDREDAEQRNLFRYQVARSRDWQAWFDGLAVDWRVKENVDAHMPDTRLLALAQLTVARAGYEEGER